ncbi:MAG: sugar phosphate nucleotidyltransferase [Melioribacteraceae bacterium]|nr:sugar phosphate nucleotidyltransferase [Melioribacteraceae bacterium]
MNERLVILAGGISSRMKKPAEKVELDEATLLDAEKKSKSMIRVGTDDRPFLDYLLYNVSKTSIKDVVILIGEKDDSIKQYYGEGKNNQFLGLTISYAIQPIPKGREKPLGTADALYHALIARPDWSGNSFYICNSDNLYSIEVFEILINSEYKNALIDYDRDGLNFETKRIEGFAVTEKNEEGFLLNIIEKPDGDTIENLRKRFGFVGVSMNIFKFDYDIILKMLEETPLNPIRKEKEIPTSIMMLIQQNKGEVFTYYRKEHVPDLTSKDDIIPVREYLEKNFSHLEIR